MRATTPAWNDLLTAAHVWKLRPNNAFGEGMLSRYFSWLSADERACEERFQTEALRRSYVAARILCRAVLSRYVRIDPRNWRFDIGLNGKPKIVEPAKFRSLQFNISHTEGLIVCGVSRAGDIGVDVEKISRTIDIPQVARYFLSSREQLRLAALRPHARTRRFFELWVLKEAYLKGTGRGLAEAAERLTIELDDNGEPATLKNWNFSLHWIGSTHVAAAAVRYRKFGVSIHWFDAADLFEAGVAVVGGRVPWLRLM